MSLKYHGSFEMKRVVLLMVLAVFMGLAAACSGPANTPTPPATAIRTPTPAATATAVPTAVATKAPTSTPAPVATATPAPQSKVRTGGIFRIAITYPAGNIDPVYHDTEAGRMFGWPGYDGLVSQRQDTDNVDQAYEIVPALAERWDVSADGKTLTFTLRKDVRFHDGSAFTADDVAYTINSVLHPAAQQPSLRKDILSVVQDVQVKDPYTIVLVVSRPDPVLMTALATLPIASRVHHPKNMPYREVDMGTGPFKLTNARFNQIYTWAKNADYWKKGSPYLDGQEVAVMGDAGAAIAAFRTRKIDSIFLPLPPATVSQLKTQNPGATSINSSWLEIVEMFMNVGPSSKGKPWSDARVRQAISLGIDRDSYIKAAWGSGIPTTGQFEGPYRIPQADWASLNAGLAGDPEANRAQAKRLLADAGFANGFKATLTVQTQVGFPEAGAVIQDQLKKIGIELSLSTIDYAQLVSGLRQGQFDMALETLSASTTFPEELLRYQLETKGVLNYSQYSNPKVDQLFQSMLAAKNEQERVSMSYQVQKIALQDMPFVPLNQRQFPFMVWGDVHNLLFPGNWTGTQARQHAYIWKESGA